MILTIAKRGEVDLRLLTSSSVCPLILPQCAASVPHQVVLRKTGLIGHGLGMMHLRRWDTIEGRPHQHDLLTPSPCAISIHLIPQQTCKHQPKAYRHIVS